MEGLSSTLLPLNHITFIGLSPFTSQCKMAVSPFFTVTSLEGAEKYGDAKKGVKYKTMYLSTTNIYYIMY